MLGDVRLVLGLLCHRRDGGCVLHGNRRAGEMSEELHAGDEVHESEGNARSSRQAEHISSWTVADVLAGMFFFLADHAIHASSTPALVWERSSVFPRRCVRSTKHGDVGNGRSAVLARWS